MVDCLGWRGIIGIVMPSTNTSVQPECEALRPRGVTNHIARISIPERKITTEDAFAEHVEAMRSGIGPAVDQVMTCAPQHLIMGVALEAFWGGAAKAEELRLSLEERAGVGVSMGSESLLAALECFKAKRIAVLTPHQPRGDKVVSDYLEEAGYSVVRLKGLKCPTPRMIAHTTEAEVREAYRELDGDDVDAIVQVGTNLAGMAVSAEAERWLGKPVLSMNALTYWNALRRMGLDDKIYGYGRLLEEF
ncbi:arylmalonate decarboxylase [Novosphingobium sp. BL-52-GroH]|uniref:maleate cis-trans isomerase family protein n=1 Tax=Novosphingobium sp. BL-52-GroH TaxID=3349877 RepID=UPI00384A959C